MMRFDKAMKIRRKTFDKLINPPPPGSGPKEKTRPQPIFQFEMPAEVLSDEPIICQCGL
jgi:hypothetical protein